MDWQTRFAQTEQLLRQRGASQIAHPGGNLFEHVRRVASLLEAWCSGPDLQLAGLSHAFYGTDGFASALLCLDERPLLRSLIGEQAEAMVYTYASCDRRVVYQHLGEAPVEFRDRFTGESSPLGALAASAFVEMTVANELDIFMVNPEFAESYGRQLCDLLSAARRYLSAGAWESCRHVLKSAGVDSFPG